jgi:hypothetical protein
MRQLVDDRSQISIVPAQCRNGFALLPSEAEQYRNLDIPLRTFDQFDGIVPVVSHHLGNDDFRTLIASAHVEPSSASPDI